MLPYLCLFSRKCQNSSQRQLQSVRQVCPSLFWHQLPDQGLHCAGLPPRTVQDHISVRKRAQLPCFLSVHSRGGRKPRTSGTVSARASAIICISQSKWVLYVRWCEWLKHVWPPSTGAKCVERLPGNGAWNILYTFVSAVAWEFKIRGRWRREEWVDGGRYGDCWTSVWAAGAQCGDVHRGLDLPADSGAGHRHQYTLQTPRGESGYTLQTPRGESGHATINLGLWGVTTINIQLKWENEYPSMSMFLA